MAKRGWYRPKVGSRVVPSYYCWSPTDDVVYTVWKLATAWTMGGTRKPAEWAWSLKMQTQGFDFMEKVTERRGFKKLVAAKNDVTEHYRRIIQGGIG